MTKTLQELIDASIFLSTEYQAVLAELSQGADWDVDFSAPSFTLQTTPPVTLTPYLLGTESESRGSWIWSWQELGHFDPQVVSAAVQTKQAGERHEVAELTTDEMPLQEGMARRLTLAAKSATGLFAHYPARAGGNITAWLLLDGEQFDLPRLTEQRMMQVIGESLTTDTAVDHNLAVASYAELRGAHVEWDTDATCVVTVHDGAQRFWFDDHQITGAEPAEPSVGERELLVLERQAEARLKALREDRAAALALAARLGEQQRVQAAEDQRREREEAAAASAPVETGQEQPLPQELDPQDIEAPEPEQPAGDVAADRPFDQEPAPEPSEPGRVETHVLPEPETSGTEETTREPAAATAGPASSPDPNTTAMSRIPEAEHSAASLQAPHQGRERVEPFERPETDVPETPQTPLHEERVHSEQPHEGDDVQRETVAPATHHEPGTGELRHDEREEPQEKKKGFFSRFFGL